MVLVQRLGRACAPPTTTPAIAACSAMGRQLAVATVRARAMGHVSALVTTQMPAATAVLLSIALVVARAMRTAAVHAPPTIILLTVACSAMPRQRAVAVVAARVMGHVSVLQTL